MIIPGLLNLERPWTVKWLEMVKRSILLLCLPTVTYFFIINMQILIFFSNEVLGKKTTKSELSRHSAYICHNFVFVFLYVVSVTFYACQSLKSFSFKLAVSSSPVVFTLSTVRSGWLSQDALGSPRAFQCACFRCF